MLRDLEARQTAPGAKPAYQDLNPVRPSRRPGVPPLLVALLIVTLLAGGLYLGSDRIRVWRQDRAAAPVTAAELPKAVPPAVVARVPEPADAPAPVLAEPATAPVSQGALPPLEPPAETKPSEASLPATTVAAAHAPVAVPVVPPVKAPAPRSPVEPGARIVKAAEPVAAAARERRPREVIATKPKSEPVPAISENSDVVVDKKLRPLTVEEAAEAGYRQAVRLLDQGRPDEALRQLRGVLATQPKHIKARELAAGIELQQGHWREAEKLLEEGLRQVSNHYLFARMLARVYVDHGSEGKALTVMESALPSGSDDADFSSLLGLLYQRAARHGEAVKAYERAAALRPNDGRIWLGFAISLEGTAQWAAAKNAYRRAQQSELPSALARYAEQRLAALRDQ